MSFKIVTDTSANLPTEMIKELDIGIIPFSYYIEGDENECLNTETFDGPKFYADMAKGKKVTTSQINPSKFIEYLEEYPANGEDVLFISMSSGISGSYNSSCIAVEQLCEKYPDRKIFSIDTYGASLGEGLPVLKAIECKKAGMTIDETVDEVLKYRDRLYQVFTVDNLKYLKQSGRISGAVAIVGTVLQIKPLLKGNEIGQIVNFDKVRGRKKSIESLAKKYDELVKNPENQVVGIAHCDCEEDAIYLEELLRKNNPPKDILRVWYEPVTGSHVGLGTLALFFESESGVRSK